MNVVTVRRQNKVLNVPEERLDYYLSEGYDQIDKNGKVTKHATGGKEVPLGEHNQLVDRVADLEKENTTLRMMLEEAQKEDAKPGEQIKKVDKVEDEEIDDGEETTTKKKSTRKRK